MTEAEHIAQTEAIVAKDNAMIEAEKLRPLFRMKRGGTLPHRTFWTLYSASSAMAYQVAFPTK
jgi:hypothetical protein